ncbi:hypothetical protein EOM39_06785 [Candidatus Gracilibacteria bacterium]|nr:hypothetical protein [Candidatus Gracilibacteria bacterium]
MTTITIKVPDKYKSVLSDKTQLERVTSYFIDDYLLELYQDSQTKKELENNSYDKLLNTKIKSALGI